MSDPQEIWVCVKEGLVGVIRLMSCSFLEDKCGQTVHLNNLETLSEMAEYNWQTTTWYVCQKSCLMSLDLYVWAPCVSIKVKEREENALILASAVLGWIKKKKKSKYMKKPQIQTKQTKPPQTKPKKSTIPKKLQFRCMKQKSICTLNRHKLSGTVKGNRQKSPRFLIFWDYWRRHLIRKLSPQAERLQCHFSLCHVCWSAVSDNLGQ